MGRDRKWLVVSFFADVDGMACSHHIDDRIAALRRRGIETVTVCNVCSPKAGNSEKRRTHSFAPSGLRYELRYATERAFSSKTVRKLVQTPALLLLMPAYLVESVFAKRECQWSWWLSAYRAAVREAERGGFELIYSTGGPTSAHVAAYLAAKKTGLPWIAELQDPIVGSWLNDKQMRFYSEMETRISESADAVVFMTDSELEEASKRVPLDLKGHFVRPGAPIAKATADREPTGKFVIGHFGSLSGSRDIVPVLQAITKLLESTPSARENFKLLIMGHIGKGQQAELEKFPHREMIDIREKCGRRESIKAMSECDMLLLVQDRSETSRVTIPSKAYEYIGIGVPVLGLVFRNPELGGILDEFGHKSVEADDADAIAKILKEAYSDSQAGRPIAPGLKESTYTVENAATKLIKIADDLLKAKKDDGRR